MGDGRIGLGISPHACRHAVATLILAVEPGNFAKAASVLGDTEETVRKHYGRDSGEQAAKAGQHRQRSNMRGYPSLLLSCSILAFLQAS